MKYAHYDISTKKLLGWYDSEVSPSIPTPNIEVSEEDWQSALTLNANYVDIATRTLSVKDLKTQSEKNADRVDEIVRRLIEIDMEGARPLRAIVNNTYTQEDVTKLDMLDLEAANLRAERLTLV